MVDEFTAAGQFRAAALRMVAAAEYFKSAGDLPPWARSELESWTEPPTDDSGERPSAPPSPPAA
jgi:hypothetical protein